MLAGIDKTGKETIQRLKERGLESAYHVLKKELSGYETEATFACIVNLIGLTTLIIVSAIVRESLILKYIMN